MNLFSFIQILLFVTVLFLLIHENNFSDLLTDVEEFINASRTYELPKNNDAFFKPEKSSSSWIDFGTYDFIIVGAGSAGAVLASRLTEEKFTVLVVEAGKKDPNVASILGLFGYFPQSDWNWGYSTVPQTHSCLASKEQRCTYPRGKSLGGTSIINAGMYVRGHPKDYDDWEKLGNIGWSYRDCLPYFKKSERAEFDTTIDREYHGFEGLQSISVVNDTPNLTTVLIDAFKELGFEERDFNGEYQCGVSRMQFYLDYNIRASTAHSFIRPIGNRTNLNITLQSLVTKIKISNKKAHGVEFQKDGKKYFAYARKEVIVSAGAINSPQVLMLSGIGPAKELKKHGIDVIADLPVGEYLSDHMLSGPITYRTNEVRYNNTLSENLELWKEAKRPLVASVGVETVSFWNLEDNKYKQPDVSFYASTVAAAFTASLHFTDDYAEAFKTINDLTDVGLFIGLLHPKSLGRVTLQSKNPRDYPLIDTNYFSDPRDLETMYKGIEIALKLNNTETFKKWGSKTLFVPSPKCDHKHEIMSKQWFYCTLRNTATTLYHPIGTTRMGIDPKSSVVNSELKVHGIKNLRVVDAGVMPEHISGHTNAPVVMIAEKTADSIKAEYSYKDF